MGGFTTVARLDEVPEGALHGVEVDGVRIVIANSGGMLYALKDECSHEEFPLSSGELNGGRITCILHGASFDLATGAVRALPAVRPVPTYECRVQGNEIQVKVD
ncbi:MAG: non-heme iron oxygenase ferredoxin subunit [Gemmatimonadota bacterium]